MLIGALSAVVLSILMSVENDMEFAIKVGALVAIVSSVTITTLVVKSKNGFSQFKYLVLILLSGIMAAFAGGLGGLLPAAYLTTKKSL